MTDEFSSQRYSYNRFQFLIASACAYAIPQARIAFAPSFDLF
jgi:hypothetical protein